MNDGVKDVLIELGLTSTESRVYLSMLELGPSSVQNIAKKAAISRTAAYEIIEALQEKGLASTFNQGKKTLFSAEDPNQLERYFRSRVDDMRGQLGQLKNFLPELRLMHGGDRPNVRYYTGIEGLRALYRDVASLSVKELFEVVDTEKTYSKVDEKVVLKLRSGISFENISAKVLHRGEVKNPRPKSKYRLLDKSFGEFDGIIWIYKNRVAFISLHGELDSVIIESAIFSDTMRVMFNAAWENAKPTKI